MPDFLSFSSPEALQELVIYKAFASAQKELEKESKRVQSNFIGAL